MLPYKAAKSGNFLQNNKSAWLPIFIVLMLLSLMLLLYVVLNSRRATVATTGIVAGPVVRYDPAAAGNAYFHDVRSSCRSCRFYPTSAAGNAHGCFPGAAGNARGCSSGR